MYQRLIPSILLQNGRLVKGKAYAEYLDAGSPATTARAHNAQGADELVVCDIDASKLSKEPDLDSLKKIADECFMPITFFGGIRNEVIAKRTMDSGADKLGLTTTVYDNPEFVTTLAHRYGAQAVVIGLDVIEGPEGTFQLYDHRTANVRSGFSDPFAWVKEMVERGAGEIRLMSVDREGMSAGLNLDLYRRIKSIVTVPVLLEGGAGSLNNVEDAYKAGADGVCVGSMLVFSDANLVKIKQHMRSKGLNIRG